LENFSPLCTFCSEYDEKIEHLFYDCPISHQLIVEACNFFNLHWNLRINITKKQILFGKNLESPASPTNIIMFHLKKYIWYNRCKKIPQNFDQFLTWFKNEMEIMKIAFGNSPHLGYLNLRRFQI